MLLAVLLAGLVALGFIAGFIGTLLGVGGGLLISPTLIALGFEPHVAVSSSLTAVIGTGVGGLYQLYRRGLVVVRLALLLEATTSVGALLGSLLSVRLPGASVALVVALVLALAGTIVLLSPTTIMLSGWYGVWSYWYWWWCH